MRTHVFYNLPESACYGCQACAQICPVGAIEMLNNREGFLYPKINSTKCIECNLCEKTCPTQENVVNPLFHTLPKDVQAAWNINFEDRLTSTSGGIFYVLGRKWIENGGIVYGVDFDDHLNVVHTRVNNIAGLQRLRGSKYVQSDITGILQQVKDDLKNGLKVLFSGTPCQVGGLRTFLKKDYENLVCVDLVCHGTPSPLIFKEHISFIQNKTNQKIIDYKFRGKEKTGWRAYIKYIYPDGKSEKKILGNDFFAYSFYKSRFNRKSCFSCGFSRSERVGDITLSDFWNAEKYYKPLRLQRKYGFNLIMCNNQKGQNLLRKISSDIESITLPVDVAIKGDVRLRHSEPIPPERDSIFEEFYLHGYEWLTKNRCIRHSWRNKIIPIFIKNLIYEIKARI